jgi:hypothetical protein
MITTCSAVALALSVIVSPPQRSEPAPRTLAPLPLRTGDVEFASIAGARELRDRRVLVSDAGGPAIYVIDPRTGAVRKLGREGAGPNEYRRPGGIYPNTNGGSFVLDRGQARVLAVDAQGTLTGTRSIEVRGFSSAADDVDPRRIDGALHTYYSNSLGSLRARPGGGGADSLPILRFDPRRQRSDTVGLLGRTTPTVISSENGVTRTRTPIFSPADGWGVASDGSVAIVRATPYRVEWIAPDGGRTTGTTIAYMPVAVTAADREAREGPQQSAAIGSRTAGGRTTSISTAGVEAVYADVKPAFDPEDIIVAPDGKVWVGRHEPARATHAVYDVFDRSGARVDRIALPPRARVVGFGPTAVYAAELDADDIPHLRKYRLAN